MIISHRYKFIFLKTNKTAGTSVEIALSKICGPDDVITPISPEDEKTRKELGYRGCQNYKYPKWEFGFWRIAKYFRKGIRNFKFYNHMSAREIRAFVGPEIWDSYYKFAVERNPWDRIVSFYYWHKPEPLPPFSKFLKSRVLLRLKRKGFDVYTIKGKNVADKICRFENIATELEEVRLHLGIPESLDMPRAKSRSRKIKRDHKEYFDEEERAKVAKLFSREIELFGYEF